MLCRGVSGLDAHHYWRMVYGEGEEFNAATSDADGSRGEGSRPPLVQFWMSPDIFLDSVIWLSLEELAQQADPDPLLALLTLPVRPEAELVASTQQILKIRPDLLSTVLTILFERFPTLTPEEIMVIAGIPTDQLLHTRAAQDLLDRGRQEGEAQGEAKLTLRQLNRRCGPLSEATTARIQALPLVQLESLAEALLDFSGPADLATWLAEHSS